MLKELNYGKKGEKKQLNLELQNVRLKKLDLLCARQILLIGSPFHESPLSGCKERQIFF